MNISSMKAIVVKPVWVDKILSGEKTIETRTWKTKIRGNIMLVSGVPVKKAVAIIEIINCREMTNEDEKKACVKHETGLKAWDIRVVEKIVPFSVRGMPGIFKVNYEKA